jgi:hypothetical protein
MKSLAIKWNRWVLQFAINTNIVNVRTSEAGTTLELLLLLIGYMVFSVFIWVYKLGRFY